MKKKIAITLLIILALICLTTKGVFAAPQSSPNVSAGSGYLKDWTYDSNGNKYIYHMRGTTGAMGNTASLDVHLQRNTEYGAMLILGISDYGKQASGVNYNTLFSETKNGLATTTGNVSGIYQVGAQNEFVAAGKSDSTKSYYLNRISSLNRDEYTTAVKSDQKKGDAMNLFGNGTATSKYWIRDEGNYAYYSFSRYGFRYSVYQTYDYSYRNDSFYDNGRRTESLYARAVVTQYN